VFVVRIARSAIDVVHKTQRRSRYTNSTVPPAARKQLLTEPQIQILYYDTYVYIIMVPSTSAEPLHSRNPNPEP